MLDPSTALDKRWNPKLPLSGTIFSSTLSSVTSLSDSSYTHDYIPASRSVTRVTYTRRHLLLSDHARDEVPQVGRGPEAPWTPGETVRVFRFLWDGN